jgi:hypothetical protein
MNREQIFRIQRSAQFSIFHAWIANKIPIE